MTGRNWRAAATIVLVAALSAVPAAGQVTRPATEVAAGLVRQARAALAKGQAEEVLRLSNEALQRDPASRDALALKTGVLIGGGKLDLALDAYDAWQMAAKREDQPVLASLGRGVLQALTTDPNPSIRARAFERLARAGDRDARAALAKLRDSRADAAAAGAATEALARLGEAKAGRALLEAAASGSMAQRLDAIRAVGESRPAGAAKVLVTFLTDPNPMIRSAALNALTSVGDRSVVAAVRKALSDSDRIARLGAAATLKRLGDSSGDAILAQGLGNDLADVRLLAASAFKGSSSRAWATAIKPILDDMNGRNRLIAAELLLPVDRAAALDTIGRAAADENPWVRADAARLLASDPALDVAAVRAVLRDVSPWARLYSAGRLAGLGPTPARPVPAKKPTRQ